VHQFGHLPELHEDARSVKIYVYKLLIFEKAKEVFVINSDEVLAHNLEHHITSD